MPINWLVDEPIGRSMAFDPVFRSNAVLLSIAGTYPTNWVKAGYLEIAIEVDGQPFMYASKLVKLGNNLIPIGISNYKLSFNPVIYLENRFSPVIKIAEFNIDMQVAAASNSLPEVGEDVFNNFVPVQGNAPSPVFLILTARSRRAARITNKTSTGMYVKCGAIANPPTLVANDPFTFVPPGSSYTFEDYSGDVVGIMSGTFALGGQIIVVESPYKFNLIPPDNVQAQ